MKIFSFILDIIPVVGGVKMLIESLVGKEMSGTILKGTQRLIHFLFGILSLILDVITVGIVGSAARGTLKILSFGLFKGSTVKVVGKVAGKGFLRRGSIVLARNSARGTASRAVFGTVAKSVGKLGENFIGRRVINYTERKIRKGAEHTLGDIYGYRVSKKKRQELREKYGASSRSEVIEAQKMEKSIRKGKLTPSEDNIQSKPTEPKYENFTKDKTFKNDFGRKPTPHIPLEPNRARIIEAQRQRKAIQGLNKNNISPNASSKYQKAA